jgi:hypothetical protein
MLTTESNKRFSLLTLLVGVALLAVALLTAKRAQ